MPKVEIVTIKDQDDGMRLNRWFLKYYPNLPLARLQKLLRTKQIKVDGKKAEVSLKLCSGQQLRIPPINDEMTEVEKGKISKTDEEFIKSLVVYKDENIIVLNKPSGVAVQGGTNTKHHIDGMLEALRFEKEEAPRLVHRIDKDTSGILVLARDRKNAEVLTRAFKEKDISKTYLAVVQGKPKKDKMIIDAPLLKSGEKMIVSSEGQKSLSEMEVLDCTGDKVALVKLSPKTGRTHQLRVHMQYIGNPIIGDDKYGSRDKLNDIANKLHLHAYKIDLSSIYKKLVVKAMLPDYFNETLATLGLELPEI
ncbi:MAG: RluA family pseudouridine synthase [Alphaproteobacteria bacterium]|nr:RluA family pseudouridine synthase [Alphaproteobacteria bacterium]